MSKSSEHILRIVGSGDRYNQEINQFSRNNIGSLGVRLFCATNWARVSQMYRDKKIYSSLLNNEKSRQKKSIKNIEMLESIINTTDPDLPFLELKLRETEIESIKNQVPIVALDQAIFSPGSFPDLMQLLANMRVLNFSIISAIEFAANINKIRLQEIDIDRKLSPEEIKKKRLWLETLIQNNNCKQEIILPETKDIYIPEIQDETLDNFDRALIREYNRQRDI